MMLAACTLVHNTLTHIQVEWAALKHSWLPPAH